MMLVRRVAAASLMLLGPRLAGAQMVSTLDVGAASVTYDNAYRVSAMSLTPAFHVQRPRASLFATGTLSRFETGSFSSNGSLFGSLFSSGTSRVRGELAASLSGSAHEDRTRAGRYLGQARLHLLGARVGVWLGGGAGQTWDGAVRRGVRIAELGGWWRRGELLVAGFVEPTGVGDTAYTDTEASVRWTRSAFETGASVGVRMGGPESDAPWGSVSGMLWLGRFLALSAATGRYPTDHVQGIPGGTYLSIGLRVASRPRGIDLSRVDRSSLRSALMRPVAGRIELHPAGDAGRAVWLEASGARVVELMGDFTEWKVVRLEPIGNGRWQVPVRVAAGTYRFNVRVDGGAWGVPRGVTTITDDFEGVVGILIVQ